MKLLIALTLAVTMEASPTWQTGQLIDASSERVLAGTVDNPYSPFPSTQARYSTERSYVIRSGDREYTVAEQRSRYSIKDRAPHLVVNTPIRFRIEKRKFIFVDEDGKEFKGDIQREAAVKP